MTNMIKVGIMMMLQALRDAASTRSGVGGVNVSQGHSGLGSYPRWAGQKQCIDDSDHNDQYPANYNQIM